ncbi:MAG: nucleoside-diphosphate sugar epimerase/dehydratase [Deferrisomatales bacterium]|nr:nucleoside-diphosphate sugar epimerase/dehydratase [Deferrisomatales bacterium]
MQRYRRLFLLPVDAVLVALSLLLAYLIRFEGKIPDSHWPAFWTGMAVSLAVKPAFFFLSGFYRRLWRYASINDLIHIVKTVFVACLASTVIALFLTHFDGYSRSVPILDWVFLNALILGRSLAWRLAQEHTYSRREEKGAPILIVGAGMAGRMLLQEIKHNPELPYHVAGFLDDDPAKVGAKVSEVPVLGRIAELPRIARFQGVTKVLIAIPSAPSTLVRKVVHACQEAGLAVQTLPPITDMLDPERLAAQLREVNLEDLLGRDPVRLDVQRIQSCLAGRRVLVTGAGGSIGSEICRQIARFEPQELILLEVAETPLHDVTLELQRTFPRLRTTPLLADVRDGENMAAWFGKLRPQMVFHAAAYKHVPMMELHPLEAVRTNVFGTRNLVEAADAAGVERFVMISTDKAVNPTNVMGASKRAAEVFVQAFAEGSNTEFVTVRFGNVLGSNGSVVPLFQAQIARGGPVTVTHPDVTRYFMTIPEASQLVLQAGSMGRGGEIFLLDMGEPVKIVDLAEELVRLSGLVPHQDVDITFTGLRPGEKLFEELLIDGEGIKPTDHKKILVAAACSTELKTVERHLQELTFCVRKGDDDLVVHKLQEMVPEYRPAGRAAGHRLQMHPSAVPPEAPSAPGRGPWEPGGSKLEAGSRSPEAGS